MAGSSEQSAAPSETAGEVRIRPVDELDIEEIAAIDEGIGGRYRPEVWEKRVFYYLRRDPEGSFVAEVGGKVVGFMLGEVRSGTGRGHLGVGAVGCRTLDLRRAGGDAHQQVAGAHGVTLGDEDVGDGAVDVGVDHVLHLHRLEHHQRLVGADVVALVHLDRHDGALHGRRDRRVGRCHRRAVPLSR